MKRDSKSVNDVKQFIEDYAQANNILDDLDKHNFEAHKSLPQKVKELEIECIRIALHEKNKTQAAAELGISRELLHYKMKKYQIKY